MGIPSFSNARQATFVLQVWSSRAFALLRCFFYRPLLPDLKLDLIVAIQPQPRYCLAIALTRPASVEASGKNLLRNNICFVFLLPSKETLYFFAIFYPTASLLSYAELHSLPITTNRQCASPSQAPEPIPTNNQADTTDITFDLLPLHLLLLVVDLLLSGLPLRSIRDACQTPPEAKEADANRGSA